MTYYKAILACVAVIFAELVFADDATSNPALKQFMATVVAPASNVVFGVANEAPKDDAGWAVVEKNALLLAELAKQIQKMSPADHDAWDKQVGLLVERASIAATAAKSHDADKISDIGNDIYETCAGCHTAYPVKPK